MTDEPTPDNPAAPAQGGGASTLPPVSRTARALTDRSRMEEAPTDEAPARVERVSGPRIWPRVLGVLILLLGTGGVWLWLNPGYVETSLRPLLPGFGGHDAGAASIKVLEARVARLEQRQPPADLAPLAERLEALEKRLPPPGQAAGQPASRAVADLGPVLARLDALEARPAASPAETSAGTGGSQTARGSTGAAENRTGVETAALLARIGALERKQAAPGVDPAKIDALASRIDALSGHDRSAEVDALASRLDALTSHDPATELRGKLDDVEHRLDDLTAGQSKLAADADRSTRMAKLGAVQIALASGHPVGSIPDAPPALARFANAAPPTEAGLRLAFDQASRAAVKVSQPETEGKPFLDRVLARLRDSRLITVREGEHVVIGDPTAETLAHAQVLLDAGDLNGAAAAVATLSGPPAEKMAAWLADAQALQSAREALASLAESG